MGTEAITLPLAGSMATTLLALVIAIAGMATLVAGLAILNAYRAWTADWRVLVTVIGWFFIVAGLIRLILPTLAETLAPAVYSGPAALMVAGVVVLIIGGILSFEGYRTANK